MGAEQKRGPLSVNKFIPLVREAVVSDAARWKEGRKGTRVDSQEVLRKIFGENLDFPIKIPPSTASMCLRWVGYEVLGYKGVLDTVEKQMIMHIGQGAHYQILNILRPFGVRELPVFLDEPNVDGRLDFLFRNPATGEDQIIDLKFVGDYAFKLVKREGLPDYLKDTPDIYNPGPEAKKQVLLYVWMMRQYGKKISCANIVYISRDTGEMKECIVPWDAAAEHDVEQFLGEIKEALANIKEGKLPEPTVESPHICRGFCPFRVHCEFGQKFAAGKIKAEKKRKPTWLRKQIVQDRQAREQAAIGRGEIQPKLPSFGDPET